MLKIVFPIFLCLLVLQLFRSGRLNLDLSGILIISLAGSLMVSINERVLLSLADLLSIVYPPLAILAVAIGFLSIIVIVLAVMVSELRQQNTVLLQKIALLELSTGNK